MDFFAQTHSFLSKFAREYFNEYFSTYLLAFDVHRIAFMKVKQLWGKVRPIAFKLFVP